MKHLDAFAFATVALCGSAHAVARGRGVTGSGDIVCREIPQPSCTR